ncbi:MAG: hypothetical protein A2X86_07940 [Bdellovibrionales bacterium GWA2_49_15]|nr:MAG: hypothetical protein A2X86_07940 [Bdellovibrionales bacterium GWA2_49_15]HAZ11791.1 hypothetical protein [Bdellovibrionales bacterium]
MDYIQLREQHFSFLGRGSKYTGVFQLQGPTKISAELEGEIEMGPSDHLTIEILGRVKGNIRCFDLEIFGHFEGIIYARGTIIIHHTAHVSGEINATNVIIKPGAILNTDLHTNEKT